MTVLVKSLHFFALINLKEIEVMNARISSPEGIIHRLLGGVCRVFLKLNDLN